MPPEIEILIVTLPRWQSYPIVDSEYPGGEALPYMASDLPV